MTPALFGMADTGLGVAGMLAGGPVPPPPVAAAAVPFENLIALLLAPLGGEFEEAAEEAITLPEAAADFKLVDFRLGDFLTVPAAPPRGLPNVEKPAGLPGEAPVELPAAVVTAAPVGSESTPHLRRETEAKAILAPLRAKPPAGPHAIAASLIESMLGVRRARAVVAEPVPAEIEATPVVRMEELAEARDAGPEFEGEAVEEQDREGLPEAEFTIGPVPTADFEGAVLRDTVLQDTVLPDGVVPDGVVQDTVVQAPAVGETLVLDTGVQGGVVQDTVVRDTVAQGTRWLHRASGATTASGGPVEARAQASTSDGDRKKVEGATRREAPEPMDEKRPQARPALPIGAKKEPGESAAPRESGMEHLAFRLHLADAGQEDAQREPLGRTEGGERRGAPRGPAAEPPRGRVEFPLLAGPVNELPRDLTVQVPLAVKEGRTGEISSVEVKPRDVRRAAVAEPPKPQPEAAAVGAPTSDAQETAPREPEERVPPPIKRTPASEGRREPERDIEARPQILPPRSPDVLTKTVNTTEPQMPARVEVGPGPLASPHQAVADVLREIATTEGTKPVRAAIPAQEIAVRIPNGDAQPVDLQVVERAGRVRVDVRTSDTGLQATLRQELGTLVRSLENSGYRAEALIPAETPRAPQGPAAAYGYRAETGTGGFEDLQGRRQNPQQQQQRRRKAPQPIESTIRETAA